MALIEHTIQFVKDQLKNAEGGHDWFHIERVWKLSKKIAEKENISLSELDKIKGTGLNDRVTKNDILDYLKNGLSKNETSIVHPEKSIIEITEVKPSNQVVQLNMIRLREK